MSELCGVTSPRVRGVERSAPRNEFERLYYVTSDAQVSYECAVMHGNTNVREVELAKIEAFDAMCDYVSALSAKAEAKYRIEQIAKASVCDITRKAVSI
jgi:hypothetical protein